MSYAERHLKNNSKEIVWVNSIRFRIVMMILLTTFLVMGISGYFGYRYIEGEKSAELQQLANVTASRLSQHLTSPMWDVNYEQVGKLLEAEMDEERIIGIVVLDEDRESVFSSRQRDSANKISEFSGNILDDHLIAYSEVSNGQKTFGFINVYLTKSFLKAELIEFAKGLSLIAVLLGIGITFVTTLALSSIVVKPLQKLTQNALKISGGDFKQEIDISRKDEIGYLGSTLDRMQYSLRLVLQRQRKKMARAA